MFSFLFVPELFSNNFVQPILISPTDCSFPWPSSLTESEYSEQSCSIGSTLSAIHSCVCSFIPPIPSTYYTLSMMLDAEDSAPHKIDSVSGLELFLLRGRDDIKQKNTQQRNS